MKNYFDCLFVGTNEMETKDVLKEASESGKGSHDYYDSLFNFFKYNGTFFSASDAYNAFCHKRNLLDKYPPYRLSNLFSPTISYLHTFLSKHNLTTSYINDFQNEKNTLTKMLTDNDVVFVAIPTTLYSSPLPIRDIVQHIKSKSKETKIIAGGPYLKDYIEYANEAEVQTFLHQMGADFYIYSVEGEKTLVQLISAYKAGESFEAIPNLYYLDSGNYVYTFSEDENNLLEDNLIDWDVFKDSLYGFAAIRTSKSCPFRCGFCCFPQSSGEYQVISIPSIKKELNGLQSLGNIKSVNFIDDTFNVPIDRFKDILQMMIREKYTFSWNSHLRCQYLDEATVELMKKSGCEGVFLGIESGNQLILDNMNKHVKVEQYRNGLQLLKKYEIATYSSFILGYPGETRATLQDTIDFINNEKPDFYRMVQWYYYLNAPVNERKSEYGLIGEGYEWTHNTMNHTEAQELLKEVFLKVQGSVWVPKYNFEFPSIFNLLHRGYSINQIKEFMLIFNSAIRENVISGDFVNIDISTISKFEKIK